MQSRLRVRFIICAALIVAFASTAFAQTGGSQSDLSPLQRMDVMRSKLEAMRRSLTIATSSMEPQSGGDKEKKNLDDPRQRLLGVDKDASSILSELNDVRGKQERSERYDQAVLDRLEASVSELNTRFDAAMQATAGARKNSVSTAPAKKKKKGRLFGLLGGGGDNEYAELTGTVAAGRDRVLFEEAAKQVRKGNHETGRLLFSTIINTYPDSGFLPLAKLAIADSFYLEGTTSALVQASQAYSDWLTFFPTDPLADDAMLKVAEAEMRQMGLSDRDITHARKAEQRLKALLQQYPQTNLRPIVEDHLRETQESLAMHGYQIGNFYLEARYTPYNGRKGGLKGAQSRFNEVFDKYPNFSLRDAVLFKLAFTYQQEEEPDEAAKYYQDLLRNFPNSDYSEKAKEQLSIIGVPIPEPDPARKNVAPVERPGFVGSLMKEVIGKADVTVDKDGILISKNKKEGVNDLIDEALKYNGQLPANVTPVAPVQRSTTRPVPSNPNPRPATQNATAPASTVPKEIKP